MSPDAEVTLAAQIAFVKLLIEDMWPNNPHSPNLAKMRAVLATLERKEPTMTTKWDDPVPFTTAEVMCLLPFVRAGADQARQRIGAHTKIRNNSGVARWDTRLTRLLVIEAKLQKLLPATLPGLTNKEEIVDELPEGFE
jgi:hypothetical protein